MFTKDTYGRILVPMITPFKDDQEVDYAAAVEVGQKLIDLNYADSLILTGTTGEFFTMTADERITLFKTMKDALGDKIPMIAGVGSASTIETIKIAKAADQLGFDLMMVVAPYYTKPNQDQLYQHFKAVAAAVKNDMLLYNIPIFTGVNTDPDTVAKLAKIENIVGIKEEAELNAKQITSFLNATPEDFIIYNGDDTMVLEAYAQGGDRIGGVISGGAHLAGNQIRAMIDAFQSGKVLEATAAQRKLYKLYRIMGQNGRVNPVALIKAAMKLIGYNAGIPRMPLLPATDEELANIKVVMKELGIL
ncbi:MAG: 4-hydroxy-tetrahydrodipicolinate synthase [Planctomycetes bacterium]|nr:4-hydroxy-tetrahydrodipicolinate synthase [Planctomycetota bacterium]